MSRLIMLLFALAVPLDDQFDQSALDLDRWNVFPPNLWKLTNADTLKAVEDQKQHVAHITAQSRFNVDSVRVRLRVAHGDETNSYVKLDLFAADQSNLSVMFQKTGLKVMFKSPGVSAEKPVTLKWFARTFDAGQWLDLQVDAQGKRSVLLDGEPIVELPPNLSCDGATLRVLAYRAGMELDRITVEGIEMKPPVTRLGQPLATVNYSDPATQRHYPEGMAEIGEPTEVDLQSAAALPSLSQWMIGQPDYSAAEFTDQTTFAGKRVVDFHVGRDDVKAMPTRLRWFEKKNTPEEVRLHFNVPSDGVYTLKLYLAGAKNLGNLLTVKVDGHLLYRDLMRGTNPKAIHSWFREHLPIKLKAGPHVVSIHTAFQQARFLSYMVSVYLDAVGLEPGNIPLIYDVDATEERPLGERSATVQGSRTLGRDFHYMIRNLPKGELGLELLFYEAVTDAIDFRSFDVTANGRALLRNYDIVADIGSNKVGSRAFKVTANEKSKLDLHFLAKIGRAQVNMIRLSKGGEELVAVNCGASPSRSYGFMSASDMREQDAVMPWPTDLFDGVTNVVADPGFELSADEPVWRPIGAAVAPLTRSPVDGTGEMAIDDVVRHNGQRSLRLSNTRGAWGVRANTVLLDWTRTYRLTAHVKAENATGRTCLALQWLMPNGTVMDGERVRYHSRGAGTARGNFAIGATAMTEPLAGTFDWKPVHLDVQPPRGAGAAVIMIRSDDNEGSVWFDDLTLDGYGNLPMHVIATVGGYQAAGHKSAVVLASDPIASATFTVTNLASGKAAHAGQLEHLGFYDWLGRHGYLADFSDVRAPGRYAVHVTAPDGRKGDSQPFEISSHTYLNLARLMAFYFYVSRCGQEVPGWHMACHTDDAIVQSPYYDRASRVEPRQDLVGGWHDAGDFGKFHQRTWGPLYGLASLAADVVPPWRQYGGNVPDVVSEVMWGADYTCRIHEGNGLFIGKVNGGFAGGHPAFPPSLETDGDPATVDGQGRTAAWLTMATPEPAAALAAAARAIKPYDVERAAKYLHTAITCFENTTGYWDENRGDHAPDWRDLFFDAKAMLASLELHRATGEARFLRDVETRARRILPLVEDLAFTRAPYCWSVRWSKGSYNSFQFDFLIGPMLLLRDHPEHALADDIRRVCRHAIDRAVLPALNKARTPFGQMTHLTLTDMWYHRASYSTELYPQTAYLLALAANVLDEPAYRPHAERNLQWLTGRNMFNASYVSGIADRQAAPWVGLMHLPGHENGTIPGAIAKGINWGTGSLDWHGRHRPIGLGMPAGFTWLYLDTGGGYQTHFPAMEIWEWFNHPTLMAAIELHRADAPNVKGNDLPPLPIGSANLILNSGFENVNDTKWITQHRPKWRVVGNKVPTDWDYNGDQSGVLEIINDAAQARHGVRCLKVEKPDTHRSAMLHERQPFHELKAGEVYWLSVWLRGKGKVQLWCHESDGPTAANYRYSRRLAEVQLQATWDRIDVPYRATGTSLRGAVTHGRFGFNLAPGGVVYVDDFEVRRMAQPRVAEPKAIP